MPVDLDYNFVLCMCWFGVLAVLFLDAKKMPSSGLTLVYFANLFILHYPGGAILQVDWYEYYPRIWTFEGFELTTLGLIFLTFGVLVGSRTKFSIKKGDVLDAKSAKWLGLFLVGVGLLFSVLVAQASFLFSIPTLGAILSSMWLVGAPGLCLYVYGFQLDGEKIPFHIFAIALLYPLLTVSLLGFLGFGLYFIIFIICFSAIQKKFPKWLFVFAPIVAYLFLSFFINYMNNRAEIRGAVWEGQQTESRIKVISAIFTDFEWFDPQDFFHLKVIDSRLNQNWLVGAGIENVNRGAFEITQGESLVFALVSWVPRAIWINKPVVGGSGDLASQITGITFAESTSVGVGHILELYMNFGKAGVYVGMFIIGFMLRFIDLRASLYLHQNSYLNWVRWILPGTALINVGGAFSELVASTAAFLIVGFMLKYGVKRFARI